MVPKEKKEKLEALKTALAGPSAEDQAIATQFTTAVNEVPGNITRNNRTLVDNATAIFSTMTEAQKALVSSDSTMKNWMLSRRDGTSAQVMRITECSRTAMSPIITRRKGRLQV